MFAMSATKLSQHPVHSTLIKGFILVRKAESEKYLLDEFSRDFFAQLFCR